MRLGKEENPQPTFDSGRYSKTHPFRSHHIGAPSTHPDEISRRRFSSRVAFSGKSKLCQDVSSRSHRSSVHGEGITRGSNGLYQ